MTHHDADQVIGRIRVDGGWDQRFRRPLGHSLRDEIPPRRQQAAKPREWFGIEVGTWDDVAELIAGVLVFSVLFIGTPLLLWLIGTPK